MKLVFVHINGSKKGQTEVFEKYKLLIGTHPSCDLCFSEVNDKNVCSFHAEIICNNDSVVLKDIGGGRAVTFVNKELVSRGGLKDGDLVGFGQNGPEVCVRFVSKKGESAKTYPDSQSQEYLKASLEDNLKTINKRLQGKSGMLNVIYRDFIQQPYNQASNRTKNVLLAIILLALGGAFLLFYFYFFKLQETTKRVQILESQQSFIENIIEDYRKGVCFIQGSYYFADTETGLPIKTSSDGEPITYNFSGTGFLIDPKGLILTNRHIADPVWRSGSSSYEEYIPSKPPQTMVKFAVLRAFFPEIKDHFPLEIVKVSDEADVAVLKLAPTDIKLPVLSLEQSGKAVRIGEPVILLGYPAGINAFFGKADQQVVDELITLPVMQIAEELSKLNLIRPLITQGHVTDITPDRIIYDAQTTLGGSGGPLININGKVIGINYGILRAFKGSNLAVPIKYGINLLGK